MATWGDLVAFPVRPRPALLVNDPDGVDQVLRRNAGAYSKQTVQYDTLSLLTGQGLLTAPTPLWRVRRRQLAPAFHRRTLDGLLATVDAAATAMVSSLLAAATPPGTPPGTAPGTRGGATPVAVEDVLLAGTLDIVTGALFGAGLAGRSVGVAHAVVAGLDGVIGRATSPLRLPLSVPTPANRRLRRGLGELDALVADLIEEHPRASGAGTGDLLDLLLTTVADPVAVRDEVVTLVVAGHETVASALIWALWLLSGRPDVAAELAAEAATVLDSGVPTLEQLRGLRATRAVLDETLRLYPPSWLLTRLAVEPDVVAGVAVEPGTLMIMSPWTLHRRSAAWPAPDRFDPQRFRVAPAADQATTPDRATATDQAPADQVTAGQDTTPDPTRRPDYVPFGSGPRLCIGRDFALLEATVLLARLAAALTFTRPPGTGLPRPRARVTVRPDRPLVLLLAPRAPGVAASPRAAASPQAIGRVTWSSSRS